MFLAIKTFKQKTVSQILDMLVKNMSTISPYTKFVIPHGGTLIRVYTLPNYKVIIKFLQKCKIPKKKFLIIYIIIQWIYAQKIKSLSKRTAEKQPILYFLAKSAEKRKMATLAQRIVENENFFHHSTTLGEYFQTHMQTQFR